jgi:hypothetical protein
MCTVVVCICMCVLLLVGGCEKTKKLLGCALERIICVFFVCQNLSTLSQDSQHVLNLNFKRTHDIWNY